MTAVIGRTRSREIRVDLRVIPHLLIAGQTGGGKSTLLRAIITLLFLNNEHCEFILIDLKGGLEFQLFEDLDRVSVLPDIGSAVAVLEAEEAELNLRLKLLKKRD